MVIGIKSLFVGFYPLYTLLFQHIIHLPIYHSYALSELVTVLLCLKRKLEAIQDRKQSLDDASDRIPAHLRVLLLHLFPIVICVRLEALKRCCKVRDLRFLLLYPFSMCAGSMCVDLVFLISLFGFHLILPG